MEYEKIQKLYQEEQYEEIAHMADGLNEKQVKDTNVILKIAESYRKLDKIKERCYSVPCFKMVTKVTTRFQTVIFRIEYSRLGNTWNRKHLRRNLFHA